MSSNTENTPHTMWKQLLSLLPILLLTASLSGQTPYHQMAQDTIVRLSDFPNSAYLLNGKKLNLSVMEWFMSDYPRPHEHIRMAIFTDQLSILSYTFGGVFCLSGLLLRNEDQRLGDSLLRTGAIGLASGITFQIFSGSAQRKAVNAYNREIRALYGDQPPGVQLRLSEQGITLAWLLR